MLKIILLSDLHLENKPLEAAQFVLNSINEKVETVRSAGDTPLVVLAGDVHNDTKGYDFMSQINSKVLYVAGNHEFWTGDFYEINERLIAKSPPNVEYLYNKAVVVEDTVFLGSSLWTDVAKYTNPHIAAHCSFVMNDVTKISAKKWYKNPENIKDLALVTSRAEEFTEKKWWNILAQREENEKTQRFFKAFDALHTFFTTYIDSHKNNLNYSLTSTYDNLTQSQYDEKMHHASNMSMSFKDYLARNNNFYRKYGNDGLPSELLNENEFLEPLFEQFKNIDLSGLKIAIVSHHLPFMEEILVGTHRNMSNRHGKKLPEIFSEVNENLFLINQGVDYPYHNYFYRCGKGDFEKKEDITKIAHYCNSGSKMFGASLIKKISLWMHGHEHNYNYIDYLKGIKIATNPMGYALHGLHFKDGYPQIKDDLKDSPEEVNQWTAYVNTIKTQFIQEVVIPSKEGRNTYCESQAGIWSWYLWDKEQYLKELDETAYLNKKLLSLITKKVQGQKCDQFQINTYAIALNTRIDKIETMQKDLSKAITLRTDPAYSFQAEAYDLADKHHIEFVFDMRSSRGLTQLEPYFLDREHDINPFTNESRPNTYGLRELFYNSVHLAYSKKKVLGIMQAMQSVELTSPQQVEQSLMVDFDRLTQRLDYKKLHALEEKINKRFTKLYEKVNPPNQQAKKSYDF